MYGIAFPDLIQRGDMLVAAGFSCISTMIDYVGRRDCQTTFRPSRGGVPTYMGTVLVYISGTFVPLTWVVVKANRLSKNRNMHGIFPFTFDSDDPNTGGSDVYLGLVTKALDRMNDAAWCPAIDEGLDCAAIMLAKEEMEPQAGGRHSATDYIVARWWDGWAALYWRVAYAARTTVNSGRPGLAAYGRIQSCPYYTASYDSLIFFNEISDMLDDLLFEEPMNHLLIAWSTGGLLTRGLYHDAIATIWERVAMCQCHGDHDELRRLIAGSLVIYTPRYGLLAKVAWLIRQGYASCKAHNHNNRE
ncbi:hypothetical protein HIM_11508 [Hirsutella minnesotensis 3608]|uniref:Uncharacterized protein n=1 Tax=Hirsutella minnesotensis 3608 TaxID=1043627 RepID=A0A0F7ZFG5_9HYPO|nr:hypothetical protein HIM_11508 [Hirsutella minnesotensis 3608]